jgi:hypothetical protein
VALCACWSASLTQCESSSTCAPCLRRCTQCAILMECRVFVRLYTSLYIISTVQSLLPLFMLIGRTVVARCCLTAADDTVSTATITAVRTLHHLYTTQKQYWRCAHAVPQRPQARRALWGCSAQWQYFTEVTHCCSCLSLLPAHCRCARLCKDQRPRPRAGVP